MRYKNLFRSDDLENLTEEMVFQEIYTIIERDNPPWSEDMEKILDIAAITLNQVPPKYVTRFLDKHMPREHHRQERIALHQQVLDELPKAIERVVLRPRLSREQD